MRTWEAVGDIGVDAGIVWVGDPAYVITPDAPHAFGPTWDDFVAKVLPLLEADGDVARITKEDDWGDVGVAMFSGFGDGVYPVEIQRDEASGRIAAVRITFIPPPPE